MADHYLPMSNERRCNDHCTDVSVADPENLVGGCFRARKFLVTPLNRNHAHVIAVNEIETTEQPKISMEIDFLSLPTGFLVRFCSQIHGGLSFLS